jgi:glycosyltransferase involved in cell wall biosynthesis
MYWKCAEAGLSSVVIPAGRLRHVGQSFRAVHRISQLAQNIRADLIFSWMPSAHLYGAFASAITAIPGAWYQHGLPRNTTWLNRLVSFLPAAGVIACSRTVARAERKRWPAHPTKVVTPCVDTDRFEPAALPSPETARQKLNLPEEGPLIGTVGRLQRWKGMHTLVQAMPQILRQYPDAHAVIVGGRHEHEPEYDAYLDQEIKARGLQDHVLRVGFQSNVPLWMQAMDVFVHASDHEPFGIVIIEAMALGKPVVAGSRGGPTEIITEGEDGLLAPYEDSDVLSRQLLRYLNNPGYARTLGENARERALDFDPRAYARKFSKEVSKIVQNSVPVAHE